MRAILCSLLALACCACGESPPTKPDVVVPATGLAQITLDTTSLMGGESARGTVTLTAAAPAAGVVVALSSNSPSANVPGTVAVAAGATSATFTVATQAVQSTTDVTIVASLDSVSRPITLTLTPVPPARLVALDVPPDVIAFEPASGRVTLDRPAGTGGVAVSLSSDDTTASVPATVTVPEGATNASFDISTRPPVQTLKVFITASLGVDKISAMMFIYHSQAGFAPRVNISSFPSQEPVGQGRSVGYSPDTAAFSAVSSCQGAAIKLQVVGKDGRRLIAIMTAPRGSTLGLTTYTGAQLYPNQATDRPGVFVEWEGRTCPQLFRGQFTIVELLLGDGGAIKRLRGQMELSCGTSAAPLFGVSINNLRDIPVNNEPARCP
jgi:hypothetical protein